MNQNIWGSHLWFSLHTISLNYPLKPSSTDKIYYKNFLFQISSEHNININYDVMKM